jgi:hypothetical protein
MIGCLAGNCLWLLANTAAYCRYRRAARNPRRAQEEILRRFIQQNAASEYGQRYQYAKLRTIRDFQDALPIVTYDDLEPWIEKIRDGVHNVLTGEPVLFMEKTSGSSSAAKYIPYTASLLREFRNAIGAWMFDLFTGRPGLLAGSQYWSISPVARQPEFTPGGLRVGIDDDTQYLGPIARQALRRLLAVPGSVALIQEMDECRRVTLEYLMRCRDLRFVSVWSPSFLTLLMDRLPAGARPRDYWPELQLISCWTSAASARLVDDLRERFPGAEIQGKGLLATEGVVSFPELGRPGPSPALTSHFLEFVDDDGRARLVDEIEVGRRYRVLITTGGGLARYSLGDLVEVTAPGAIEFVGRADAVCDLCGEKLSETFVGRILEDAARHFDLNGFTMLAPEWSSPPHYLLFVESDFAATVADFVEERLRASVHYDYCRRLGQLGPVAGIKVVQAADRYLRGCVALGQRPGNVKPANLRRELGWRQLLTGQAASEPLATVEAAHAG